jgi:hypothetical protein
LIDGIGTKASFNGPATPTYNSLTKILYVPEFGNNVIRTIDTTTGASYISCVIIHPLLLSLAILYLGLVTSLAGSFIPGSNDGFGTNASSYGGRFVNKKGNANVKKTGISFLESILSNDKNNTS